MRLLWASLALGIATADSDAAAPTALAIEEQSNSNMLARMFGATRRDELASDSAVEPEAFEPEAVEPAVESAAFEPVAVEPEIFEPAAVTDVVEPAVEPPIVEPPRVEPAVVEQVGSAHASLRLKPRVVSLNIMVAGLSGLGKTTTCNMLFDSWTQGLPAPPKGSKRTGESTKHVDVSRCFERFDEKANTLLRVRVIDTPGFGNNIDNKDAVRPISAFVEKCRAEQFDAQMAARPSEEAESFDALVHVCLYFLSPHRFLEIDRHFLKQVQHDVAVVPIIAKSDTLTDDEIREFRKMVVAAFAKAGIEVYDFDGGGSGSIEEQTVPQASFFDRKTTRGREPGEPLAIVARDGLYPWGAARVYDRGHSDFAMLKDILLSHQTEMLVEHAKTRYAVYRARRIRRRAVADFAWQVAFAAILVNALPQSVSKGVADVVRPALMVLARAVSALVSKLRRRPVDVPAAAPWELPPPVPKTRRFFKPAPIRRKR
ncbi:Septin-domain-containing protein [Pelagophyceae sp. CCMP2097]|nr:Septin-domain-containing protein [Pelagophyceae sp. CCMP2097]|mmetsp:Transcript_30318/g.102290  ORF Transcript_30318/g.102290 Transcript_30318/m.102290 type:complete len:486 (-) Transcript_30318:158-1615(-)